MEYRDFGSTGLRVSVLGLGAGQIGDARLDEAEVARLLHFAVDQGITLFDTARGYGLSEERLGRHLGHQRQQLVISTKVGYDMAGHADWSPGCIQAGVDAALQRLQTDYLDIVHLHSCSLAVLQQGDAIRALQDAQQAGKIRVIAYSGENDELAWAVNSGLFGSVEHSLSLCDQRVIQQSLPQASAAGLGVIAKRPVANAPWRFAACPVGDYAEEYWWRWDTMRQRDPDLLPPGLEWQELALRFSAYTPGVSSIIVGTANPAHLHHNVSLLNGPLPDDEYRRLREAFHRQDPGWWVGQV